MKKVEIQMVLIGEQGSGKTQLATHFMNNLPPGYKLIVIGSSEELGGKEEWTFVVHKEK